MEFEDLFLNRIRKMIKKESKKKSKKICVPCHQMPWDFVPRQQLHEMKTSRDSFPRHQMPQNKDSTRFSTKSSTPTKWRCRAVSCHVIIFREMKTSRPMSLRQYYSRNKYIAKSTITSACHIITAREKNLLRNQLQRRRTQKINMSRNWLPHRHTMSARLVKQNFRGITRHFNPLREGKSQRIRAKWHLSLHFTSVVTWPLIRG